MIKDRKINEWLTLTEQEMRLTLARLLAVAVAEIAQFRSTSIEQESFMGWVDKFQAQLIVLAAQISWSESLERALQTLEQKGDKVEGNPIEGVLEVVQCTLNVLADSVLHEQPPVRRRKLEHLVSFLKLIFTLFFIAPEFCFTQIFNPFTTRFNSAYKSCL